MPALIVAVCEVTAGEGSAALTTEGCPSTLTLRLDFNNTALFGCPDTNSLIESEGAQITATYNSLTNTTSGSLDGIGAAVFRFKADNDSDVIQGLRFGPYVQSDGTSQLATNTSPSKNTYQFTEGAFIQASFNPDSSDEIDYWRIRGGINESSTGTQSASVVAEYLPTNKWFGSTRDLFGTGVLGIIYPDIILQYDHTISEPNTASLFFDHDEALRVGAQATATFYLANRNNVPVISNLALGVTYHASTDALSGRGYSWVLTTLSYQITSNFGIAASYGRGNSELTANDTSQVKLGLTAKF